MSLPTLYSIGVKRLVKGQTDAHGNVTESFSDPVSVPVYSIAPTTSDEPYEAGREAVVTGLSVLAPIDTNITAYDRVVWDGEEYTVEGDIADWSKGPFGWDAGIAIQLKRVEG